MARSLSPRIKPSRPEEDEVDELTAEEEIMVMIHDSDNEEPVRPQESSRAPLRKGKRRNLVPPTPPSRANHASPALFDSRSPSIQRSRSSVAPSTDPLALDDFHSGSSPEIRPLGRRRNRKAPTSTASVTSFPSSPGPSTIAARVGRRRQRKVEIVIPLQPLSSLRRYQHSPPLQPPSTASRRSQLDDQDYVDSQPRRRPGRPRKARYVESDAWSEDSTISVRVRPKREAAKHIPSWKVNSSPEKDSYHFSDQADEETEGEDAEGYSDSDPVRRSRRKHAVRAPKTRHTRNGHSSKPIAISSDNDSEDFEQTYNISKRKRFEKMRPPPRKRNGPRRGHEESDFVVAGEGEDELELFDLDELEGSDPETLGYDDAKERDILGKHRSFCEKCSRERADVMLERALKIKQKPGKRRKLAEGEISDEELATGLQGWLECEKCCISAHWGCLAKAQQEEVLEMLLDEEGPPRPGARRRRALLIDETFTFVCAKCTPSPSCLVCCQTEAEKAPNGIPKPIIELDDDDEDSNNESSKADVNMDETERLTPTMFRCHRCKQGCHYEHLKEPSGLDQPVSLTAKAQHYQRQFQARDGWWCHQCRDWPWTIDLICAWRPLPAQAIEPERAEGELPRWKDPLPREYLVKWVGRGFRHVTWVPHAWILSQSAARLRNFLEKGPSLNLVTDETLAAKGDDMANPTIANIFDEHDAAQERSGASRSRGSGRGEKDKWLGHGPPPDVHGESSIPMEWRTVDRVLDVMLLPPPKPKRKAKANRKRQLLSDTDSSAVSFTPDSPNVHDAVARPDGMEPPESQQVDVETWEELTGRTLSEDDIDEVAKMVTWCFVKWDDLQYEQSTWDTPPPVASDLYPPFKHALQRYLGARLVDVPVLNRAQCKARDAEAGRAHTPPETQPGCIVGGKLMPFQMEGFQWLLYKHFKRESCILADDMGLGKTIQIASLLGYLGSEDLEIYPCLVVVPNSTITNWVREFEKWVPHIRVVPYYGEAASRKVISKYELYHKGLQGKATGLKAHVVLTTYDMITGNEFRVFSGIPRWEVLCIDEGQRLKSDGSLIFNRLKTLNSVHRILLTGTPLNNNLRELFNLLNFLDRNTFRELSDLEKRFENLNEGLVQELHEMIKPYILRRIKADVLRLPPKIEIIVPISLSPLQKTVYKNILERNADVLKAIAQARRKKMGPKAVKMVGGGVIEAIQNGASTSDGVDGREPTGTAGLSSVKGKSTSANEPIVID